MKKINCQMDGASIISDTRKSVPGAISDLGNYFQAAIGRSDNRIVLADVISRPQFFCNLLIG